FSGRTRNARRAATSGGRCHLWAYPSPRPAHDWTDSLPERWRLGAEQDGAYRGTGRRVESAALARATALLPREGGMMGQFLTLPPLREPRPRVDLIFFNAGGGHRASAAGLKSILEQQRRPWDVQTINLREVLEPIDFIRKITRVRVEDFYNRMLRYGLTIGTGP